MTIEFELEEQERHHDEAMLYSLIGTVTGLFEIFASDDSDGFRPVFDAPDHRGPPIPDARTVYVFDQVAEANTCAALLEQFGIEVQLVKFEETNAFIPRVGSGVSLQVGSANRERADQVLGVYKSIAEERRRKRDSKGQVAFACQECGQHIGFPAHRRGGVEVCPHCGEYVDVPD